MDDFHLIGGDVALDFVNTVADRLSRPRELLVTGADVDPWARQAGLLSPRASLRLNARHVARVWSVRECIYRLLHSLAIERVPSDAIVAQFDAVRVRVAGPARLRQCSDADCGWLFLDRSHAGQRRWCRMADCGNRAKARRFYQRGRRTSDASSRRRP